MTGDYFTSSNNNLNEDDNEDKNRNRISSFAKLKIQKDDLEDSSKKNRMSEFNYKSNNSLDEEKE